MFDVKSFLRSGFVFCLFGLFRILPLSFSSALGGLLGRLIGPWLHFHKVAKINLEHVYPSKSEKEKSIILGDVWDNLGRNIAEFSSMSRLSEEAFYDHVQIENLHYVKEWREMGKAGIVFSAHLANWEILLRVAKRLESPLTFIYRKPKKDVIDRMISSMRYQYNRDIQLIPKGPKGIKPMVRAIQGGRSMGMLIDQKMNAGVEVPFLGHPSMTADALALLSRRHHMPVLPVQIVRLGGVRFKVIIHKPFMAENTESEERDVHHTMERVNGLVGDWVNQHPGQWLWIHKRWKFDYKKNT
ncbi:MAG: hypothetical protein IPP74_05770 [Alphaproteobacteria bacterium]|nr:hypothetical protein [Alphaproteobacteria bacterium]